MMKHKVKGDVFDKTFEYVKKKAGKNGLEKLSFKKENYPIVKWFPFSEYCKLLDEIQKEIMNDDISKIYDMGYYMIKDDIRWRTVFKNKNPVEIFSTSKRQKEQYVVGEFKSELVDEGEIRIKLMIEHEEDLCTDLWCESYHGRIQAILDLTEFDGDIEKELNRYEKKTICDYHIRWQ